MARYKLEHISHISGRADSVNYPDSQDSNNYYFSPFLCWEFEIDIVFFLFRGRNQDLHVSQYCRTGNLQKTNTYMTQWCAMLSKTWETFVLTSSQSALLNFMPTVLKLTTLLNANWSIKFEIMFFFFLHSFDKKILSCSKLSLTSLKLFLLMILRILRKCKISALKCASLAHQI